MSAFTLRAITAIGFTLSLVWVSAAGAYERKVTDEGSPIRWQEGAIALRLAPAADCGPPGEALDRALEIALEAWRVDPSVPDVVVRGGSPPTRYGYFPPYERGNGVYVSCEDWPFENRLAVTVATHDVTGRMLDADIVINGRAGLALIEARTDDNRHDLASVLTHEVGHVLGLGESARRNATMWPTTTRGDIRQRTLSGDDENGIIAHYEGANVRLESYGCSASSAPSGRRPALPLSLTGLLWLAAAAIRRRYRRA